MTREEAINGWIIPAIKNTWNEKKCGEIIEALEQEPCEDAISREAILLEIDKIKDNYGGLLDIAMFIRGLPSVQPQQKTGHWIFDQHNWHCSECGESPKTMGYVGSAEFMAEHFKYCNHCGLKMVEPQESEE